MVPPDNQEITELKVPREPRDRLGLMELAERRVQPVSQGLQVPPVSPGHQAPRELLVLPEQTVPADSLVLQDQTVNQDPLDQRDQVELQDLSDKQDLMVIPDKLERLVCLEILEIKDQLVLPVNRVLPVFREPLELRGRRAHPVQLERLDSKVRLETREHQDSQDHKVCPEMLVFQDQRDSLDQWVRLGQVVSRETLDLLVLQELLDQVGRLDLLAPLDSPVLQDQLVL